VTLRLQDDGDLRVEVRDRNPCLPTQRRHAAHATTGRGMDLVAAYARECGVDAHGLAGKTVWFVITASGPEDLDERDLLEAWGFDLSEAEHDAPDDQVVLRLVGLPSRLWLACREHHDAMLRELTLYGAEHPGQVPGPDRIALADSARHWLSAQVVAELDRRDPTRVVAPEDLPHPDRRTGAPLVLDVEVPLPPDATDGFLALREVLDAAERLAVAGLLLARPGLPELVALRDWACDQAVAQQGGAPPEPWPGTAQDRFTRGVRDGATPPEPEWNTDLVVHSDRGVVAADDANRILAVSRPLAAALGWAVEDLIGRRVVVLVPPELREAHVAGFARHLTTGETRVIGVPMRLPVLRADGSQVLADVLIEQAPANPGRAVYVSWISVVD
jgi:PAS domain S-box-containing protein